MQQVVDKPKNIKSFTGLNAWREAHQLAVEIYKLTEQLPKSDNFGLAQQMQRASLSVSSNIAEGFGRQTKADTARFYVMARGSLTELQNQIVLARDTKKISAYQFESLATQTVVVIKLVGGLIRSTNILTSS